MSSPNAALRALRTDGPTPQRESAALGRWLLERAGLGPRDGLIAATADPQLRRVPFARQAEWIAWPADERLAVVSRHAVQIRAGTNLAGEPRDTVALGDAQPEQAGPISPDEVKFRAALVRTALMAQALEQIARLSVAHAEQRVQFGRPIASFQAVQTHLVTIAQQAALTAVAYEAAERTRRGFEIASAKLLANRAALTAGRAAHQVLGARGVTLEHPLSQHTKRLWAWREEDGSEQGWSTRLGSAAAAAGADRLYPAITAGGADLEI
jgi:acyl-CoA dehydrogenase